MVACNKPAAFAHSTSPYNQRSGYIFAATRPSHPLDAETPPPLTPPGHVVVPKPAGQFLRMGAEPAELQVGRG
jgi:hypothetical protein